MKKTAVPANVLYKIFDDPETEQFLAAAGERQLAAYSGTKKVKKSFAVASDEKLYLLGKVYRISRGRIRREKQKGVMSLASLARISVLHRRPTWLLGLCFFFLILSPVMVLLDIVAEIGTYTVLTPLLDAVVCLIFAAICWLLYSAFRQRLLTFNGSEGTLAVDSRFLPVREEGVFVRSLRSAAENRREQS